MPYDNTNSGALFQREKSTNGGPDFSGDIEIGMDVLQYLNNMAKAGQPAKMEAAIWRRASQKDGKPFLSVKVQVPYEARKGGQQQQSRPASAPAPSRPAPQRPARPAAPQQQSFRQEINDSLPTFNEPDDGRMPWDE